VTTEEQTTHARNGGSTSSFPEHPTEPVDYAAINAVYGALFAATVAATRNGPVRDDPIRGAELIPMGAAVFALSKVIARERIGSWVRDPFVDEPKPGQPKPSGRRLRRAVGELLTCTRCVGAWSALGVVGLRAASPQTGRLVTAVLATSAANDFMQTGFRWLCEKSNQAGARPEPPR
jgi:Protein of unknown function (DUF1360)